MSETDRTDAEIISASLRDPDVFGIVFSRYHTAVFRFAARRIGTEEAGDVASDVFVQAFRIRRRYDKSRANCLPWLYGIAGNVIGDRLRKIKRNQRLYLVAQPEPVELSPHDESDDRLVAASVALQLNVALRRLSKRDRNTLLLHALEGLTYAEIAEALGVPTGTVGSRIARARKQVSEQIPDLDQMINPMAQNAEEKDDND